MRHTQATRSIALYKESECDADRDFREHGAEVIRPWPVALCAASVVLVEAVRRTGLGRSINRPYGVGYA